MNINEYAIKTISEQEKDYILYMLVKCNWSVYGNSDAAQVLNLKPTTLLFKIVKLGIKRKLVAESEGLLKGDSILISIYPSIFCLKFIEFSPSLSCRAFISLLTFFSTTLAYI